MPMMTKSDVSFAKHTLPYPVYDADFDPYSRGYLVVAGGGGEGRSGIPNQISVLDVNNRAIIEPVADIDLSRDEDSVNSLATLATKDGLIALAGINSSQKQQEAGINEHFRAFGIRYPPRKKQKTEETKSDGKGFITPLGKCSLFKNSDAPKKETYQRLLRLSPVQRRDAPSKRIGAIASGLAKENEIIVFNATVAVPQAGDVITQIDLPAKAEAADMDIANSDQDEFSIAYCDDHNIYEQTIKYDFTNKKAEKRPTGPRRVHQMFVPDGFVSPKSQPKYRCLRFLDSQNVVTVINKPNKSGAELRIYHLYPTGPAMEVAQKTLPSRIKQATCLDVCALDADKNGNQQYVVAVAGQDQSIEVYTCNYQSATDTFIGGFRAYQTLRDVHPQQMTKLVWAPFHSPPRAPNPGEAATTSSNGEPIPRASLNPGPQYIRLASTSFGNTVVIDTFPLTPLVPQDKDSRYVLSHPNDEKFWTYAYIFVISFAVLVSAFLFTAFTSGPVAKQIDMLGFLPTNIRNVLGAPPEAGIRNKAKITSTSTSTVTIQIESATSPASAASTADSDALRSALAEHHGSPEDAAATAVIVRDIPEGEGEAGGVDIHVHPDKEAYLEKDVHAKHWHELEDLQKSYWKEKLKRAGQWAEHEGESVLQGVLWSTYAGIVGQVGGEILREL